MGGTFDEASGLKVFSSTPLAVGTGGLVGLVHARCWVLRDRMMSPNLWAFLVPAVAGGEGGTARTLRTTQWTRASCELIFRDWFVIDDLKDH